MATIFPQKGHLLSIAILVAAQPRYAEELHWKHEVVTKRKNGTFCVEKPVVFTDQGRETHLILERLKRAIIEDLLEGWH